MKKYANQKESLERIVTMEEYVEVQFLTDIFTDSGLKKKGESERFLPLFIQSCMEPGKIIQYPVEIKFFTENHEEYVSISSHVKNEVFKKKEITLMYGKCQPEKVTKGCIPCKNCGRC